MTVRGLTFAACLVLAELAENAPTLVYVHVRAVCEHVLVAMRDASVRSGQPDASGHRALASAVP